VKLPASGLPSDDVLARLKSMKANDLDTHGGRTWAYVYDTGRRDVDELAAAAFVEFLHENALDPTVFPSVLQLETEIVAIASRHLHGDEEVVGNFTSGGTESCMLAVKTARDHARDVRGIDRPEMVLPDTVHAAFQKAAHYFGLDVVPVPVDPVTFKADPERIAAAITDRTALVVASAPSYAHGVVDPIEAIAAACHERGVLLHVDACIGGWLLPFFTRLGADVPAFDFRVPGVTSISMDFHKYAYCPKGASVVLYRNRDLRRHQLYACASWPGYTVINPTIQSTKSAGPLASTWATLHHIGDDGYLEIARRTRQATAELLVGIREIPGLGILGDPEMSLIAITSAEVDLYAIVDEMKRRGWYVQPQLAYGPYPANIHLTVTATSLDRVDALLADLGAAVEIARGAGPGPEGQALLDALRDLDPDAFTPEMYQGMLAMAGLGGGAQLPEEMADINRILDALPPRLREKLLIEFLNDLFRWRGEEVGSVGADGGDLGGRVGE
jgi:sphinganine-1-phosphate aldolase